MLFKIVKPIFWLLIAVIMFAGSLFTSDFSWAVLKGAVMSPFSAGSLKTLAAPFAALVTSALAFIGFFAEPATKTDVEGINKNIDKTREGITETRVIVQGEAAKTRVVIQEELAKLKASMSPDEAKSFEEAFQEVLSSSDARKAPARDALEAGRVEDAADQILKIARQEHAASDDMARATQDSYREAGALFYPINTKKSLEGYVGAIDAGSKRAEDYIYAARLYVRIGTLVRAEQVLKSTTALSLTSRNQSIVFNELGAVSISQGDLPAARGFFEQGLEIAKGLAASDPSNAEYQRDLSVSYNKLGNVSVSLGDLPAARAFFEQDLEIAKGLALSDPSNAEYQRDLSVSYERLGVVSVSSGDLPAARGFFEQCLEIRKGLASSDPSNAEYQRDLSVSYNKLGDVSSGDLPAARGFFEQGLEIRKGLAASDPSNAEYQRDLSVGYNKLGDVSVSSGDLTVARDFFEQGLEIRKGLAASDPSNAGYQRDLIVSYSKLAGVDLENALSWWKKAKIVCDGMIIKNQLAPRDANIPDLIARKIAELE